MNYSIGSLLFWYRSWYRQTPVLREIETAALCSRWLYGPSHSSRAPYASRPARRTQAHAVSTAQNSSRGRTGLGQCPRKGLARAFLFQVVCPLLKEGYTPTG